jgi:septum formation protein
MPPPALILASGSPRRRQLLEEAGVVFEVMAAEIEELDGMSAPALDPIRLASENARRKACAIASRAPGRQVLGADTVVVLDDKIFGKPGSIAEAHDFLRALSGRTHRVITACVLIAPDGKIESFHEVSTVTFLPLAEEEIARYLAAVHVLDKAGGYALQEHGDWIVAAIGGSPSNIIGLPMEKLAGFLGPRDS